MAIVGFEFTKIHVQKEDSAKGKINISNNVAIVGIEKGDLQLGKAQQSGVRFMFEYKSLYEPKFARIELCGTIRYLTDEKNTKEIVDGWQKEKKLHKDVAEKIINSILTKCNIQSILLSNTVNLPPPVPMPKVNVEAVPAAKDSSGKETAKVEKKDKQENLNK